MAGAIIEVKYFNTFLLKKTVDTGENVLWNGSRGIPSTIGGYPVNPSGTNNTASSWVIEESRIRGGYNNTSVDFCGMFIQLIDNIIYITCKSESKIKEI